MLNPTKNLNMQKLNQYITGSSLNIKDYFKDEEPFVDLIVTSPPYWDMKQYGEIEEQTGFGQEYEAYLNDIQKIFEGVHKIAKESASLFVIVDTMKRDGKMVRLPDDMANKLEEIGWIHQDTIIWDKGKTLPWSRKGQMRNVFEYILMFTKDGSSNYKYYIDRIKEADQLKEWWINYPERYSPQGKVPDNIWEFYIPTQGSWGSKRDFGDDEFKHACPFPPEMMARLILLSTDENDVVFDPFAGTGILLATAEKMNRRYLGFDTNPDYKKVFENVTKQLVDEKWEEIQSYYEYQKLLKDKLQESIYKLRVLKFGKAVIKKLRNLAKKEESYINNDFQLCIALEEPLQEWERDKYTIGKVKYFFVWNNEENIDQARNQINEIVNKAPFTKYGLITEVNVVTKDELLILAGTIRETLAFYSHGDTSDVNTSYTLEEVTLLMNDVKWKSYFDKDVPPTISNVFIRYEDYEMLPAEKYEKQGYSKEIKQLKLVFDE